MLAALTIPTMLAASITASIIPTASAAAPIMLAALTILIALASSPILTMPAA
jgi:hypothetical protein